MPERYFKHVYCETHFLELVISKIQNKEFTYEDSDEMQLWISISSLIFSPNISLYLDINKEQFNNKIIEIEERILKAAENEEEIALNNYDKLIIQLSTAQQEEKLSLECIGCDLLSDFEGFEENWKMNGYYLTCKEKSICDSLMSNYGILAISPENINNFKSLLYDEGVAIKKRERGSWDNVLRGLSLPCNTLTIIDNYVLNDISKMEENLTQVFKALLPQRLIDDFPFQITIITSLRNDRKIDMPSEIRKEKLTTILKQVRPDLNFTVAIYKCSSDKFHDRSIITNNLLIGCGAGFDLFNKKNAQKTTTVNVVCPYITKSVKWANQAYTNLVTEIRALYNEIGTFINDSYPSFYIGKKENRLFEME